MYNKSAINIVKNFEADYMERVQHYTLKELADIFDISLSTSCDNVDLIDIVNRCMFADLMNHEPFLHLPVLGHYVIDDEHYFAFDKVGIAACDCCNEHYPVFKAVVISEHSYGIKNFIAYEEQRVRNNEQTDMYEVRDFLTDNTYAMDVAFLL